MLSSGCHQLFPAAGGPSSHTGEHSPKQRRPIDTLLHTTAYRTDSPSLTYLIALPRIAGPLLRVIRGRLRKVNIEADFEVQ